MVTRWMQSVFEWTDIELDGFWVWGYDEVPEGSTLIRSIIEVNVQALFLTPLTSPEVPWAPPIAWQLQEQNTEVTNTFNIGNVFQLNNQHILGGKQVPMQYTYQHRVVSTAGTATAIDSTDWTTAVDYNDESIVLGYGYSYEDSHAQRFFDRGRAEFKMVLAMWLGSGEWQNPPFSAISTVKQLFHVPPGF